MLTKALADLLNALQSAPLDEIEDALAEAELQVSLLRDLRSYRRSTPLKPAAMFADTAESIDALWDDDSDNADDEVPDESIDSVYDTDNAKIMTGLSDVIETAIGTKPRRKYQRRAKPSAPQTPTGEDSAVEAVFGPDPTKPSEALTDSPPLPMTGHSAIPTATRIRDLLDGRFMGPKQIADQLGLNYHTVYSCLNSRSDMFQRQPDGTYCRR